MTRRAPPSSPRPASGCSCGSSAFALHARAGRPLLGVRVPILLAGGLGWRSTTAARRGARRGRHPRRRAVEAADRATKALQASPLLAVRALPEAEPRPDGAAGRPGPRAARPPRPRRGTTRGARRARGRRGRPRRARARRRTGGRPGDARVTDEVPGHRYIDFLIPGLLGMGLMSGGVWGVGYEMRVAAREAPAEADGRDADEPPGVPRLVPPPPRAGRHGGDGVPPRVRRRRVRGAGARVRGGGRGRGPPGRALVRGLGLLLASRRGTWRRPTG